jgi:hypothetical protein
MKDFKEIIPPKAPTTMLTASQVQSGPPIEPLTRILVYDSAAWETFVDEWVSYCLKSKYQKVLRFAGANDRGIDVAGFVDDKLLEGVWDNYQCKHYNVPIPPSIAWPEIGKILWHSFNRHYRPPRGYYFVAPRGTGTTLTQYLANATALKEELLKSWDKRVRDEITTTRSVTLEGKFAEYVHKFDFSIFKPMSVRQLVEQHRTSPYFIPRFGGGLPARPKPTAPPDEIQGHESAYVRKLLDAYADHTKAVVPDRVLLGIETLDGQTFTLVRSTDGGAFRVFDGLHVNAVPNSGGTELADQHNERRDDNLSTFLLSKIDLSHKRVRRNKRGDTQNLTIRSLARLLIVNEEEIIQKRSPLSDGNYAADPANTAIFKLLLTGTDDSALVSGAGRSPEEQSRGAQLDLLEQLVRDYQAKVKELAGPPVELEQQLDKLDESMTARGEQLAVSEAEYRGISG